MQKPPKQVAPLATHYDRAMWLADRAGLERGSDRDAWIKAAAELLMRSHEDGRLAGAIEERCFGGMGILDDN